MRNFFIYKPFVDLHKFFKSDIHLESMESGKVEGNKEKKEEKKGKVKAK